MNGGFPVTAQEHQRSEERPCCTEAARRPTAHAQFAGREEERKQHARVRERVEAKPQMKGTEHEEDSSGDARRGSTSQHTREEEGAEAGDRDPEDGHQRQSKLEWKSEEKQRERMEEG
jgi:hypothetical protein